MPFAVRTIPLKILAIPAERRSDSLFESGQAFDAAKEV